MKQTKLALSAIMIVAVGLVGANFVTGSEMTEQEINAYLDSSPIKGHVTIVHSDPDGNILAYAQADNIVLSIGKDCMAEQVFGELGGACVVASSDFNTISLTDGQSYPVTANSTTLLLNDLDGVAGLEVATVTPTEKTPASGSGYTAGSGTQVDIANTFLAGTAVANQGVDGAFLLNSGLTAALAGQVFGTAVTLNEADTLLVTWTITLG